MARKGGLSSPLWLGEALRLEAAGWTRGRIAAQLGVPRGTVLRRLWAHHHPDAYARALAATVVRKRVQRGGVLGEAGWAEARLTETWAARKARLARQQ